MLEKKYLLLFFCLVLSLGIVFAEVEEKRKDSKERIGEVTTVETNDDHVTDEKIIGEEAVDEETEKAEGVEVSSEETISEEVGSEKNADEDAGNIEDFNDEDSTVELLDVKKSDWFYNSVKHCIKLRYMDGVGYNNFEPFALLTREMLITAIWKIDGGKDLGVEATFDDLSNEWSKNAIVWGKKYSIMKGVSETQFKPNRLVTTEEVIAVLCRYTAYKGIPLVPLGFDVDSSPVYSEASEYAKLPIDWAVIHRLISNDGKNFAPKQKVSRAKLAYILSRWHSIVIDNNVNIEFEEIGFDNTLPKEKVSENNVQLRDKILFYIRKNRYPKQKISFYIENMNSGDRCYFAQNKVFVAASTYKLPLAMVYYDKINAGELKLTDTFQYLKRDLEYGGPTPYRFRFGSRIKLRTLLSNMILYSDNTAAQILYRNLGGRHGFHKKASKYSDVVNYYKLSIRGNYISSQFSHDCLKYLYSHKQDYKMLLSDMTDAWGYFSDSGLKVKIAQKWGYYKGNQHNIAVVYGRTPYIISVHTTGIRSARLLNGINKIVYKYYEDEIE